MARLKGREDEGRDYQAVKRKNERNGTVVAKQRRPRPDDIYHTVPSVHEEFRSGCVPSAGMESLLYLLKIVSTALIT